VEVNFALMNLLERIEEQTEKLKQVMFGKLSNYIFFFFLLVTNLCKIFCAGKMKDL
jgi:hypothetical protein